MGCRGCNRSLADIQPSFFELFLIGSPLIWIQRQR